MIATPGVRVLLVEDDPDDYQITRALLDRTAERSYDVRWARSYEEAVHAVRAEPHDAIVLDYRLGGRTGVELLRELGSEHGIPVIMLSGAGGTDADREAMRAGAAGFLDKGRLDGVELDRAIRYAVEHREVQDELRRREREFKALVENTPDVVLRFDRKLRHTYANPAAERMMRLPNEALLGSSLGDSDAAPALTRFVEESLLLARQSQEEQAAEFWFPLPTDGRYYEARFVPELDARGETESVLMVARDITDRVLSEQALAESRERLAQAQKLEAVGRLASGVAHDFNNMLTAIQGFAQMVEMEVVSADGREYALEIRKAAERCSRLTQQLLAFGRRQLLRPRRVDLNEVIRDMQPMLRRLLHEGVRLRATLPDALPSVEVDPAHLQQVLLNLVVNARDAMPEGGDLDVETAHTPEHVLLRVRDAGCGMDEQTRQRLFEPFFTTKEHGKGTGLGLSTVLGIVEQSGGSIEVESALGEGAVFTVKLPRAARAN